MSGYAVRAIDELQSILHGAVKLAGAELGVRSFGLQVLDFPGGFDAYPEHDHSEDGQEEVYVVLRGSAEFLIDGDTTSVSAGQMVRVDPGIRRKLTPGPEGVRLLAIGNCTDGAYERPDDFKLKARA